MNRAFPLLLMLAAQALLHVTQSNSLTASSRVNYDCAVQGTFLAVQANMHLYNVLTCFVAEFMCNGTGLATAEVSACLIIYES